MDVQCTSFPSNEDPIVDVPQYPPPEVCPVCVRSVCPIQTNCGFVFGKRLEVVYRCPRAVCSRLFIAIYEINWYQGTKLIDIVPISNQATSYGPIILEISPTFAKIYSQAETAHSSKLDEIAGVGFRRSLEFLLKDYLISTHLDLEIQKQIKRQPLAACINNYVKNDNIKAVSSRAVWLGNDETHYVRKWENKDIGDLKKLISMTVNWIELEHHTLELQKDMPIGR